MNLRHLPWKVPLKLRSLGELNKFCKDLSGNEIRVLCVCVLNSLIILVRTLVCVLSRVQLFLTPMDCSPPGSSVHGIFQAGILECIAISFSRGSSLLRDWTHVSCSDRWILYHWAIWEALSDFQFSSVTQSCPTLCDPMSCSTPGLPVQHQFLEPTQNYVHWVGDAIQPSHPLSSPSPPALIPSIRVFSNELALLISWPKYWSFSFNIRSSNERPGLISFRMDWLDLLAVPGTLKSLLQHHSSKASVLLHSAFFIVQLSHPYMTTGKTIALTRQTFVGKVMSLILLSFKIMFTFLINMPSHILKF